MDENALRDTSERYKIARDYASLIEHPGYIRLLAKVKDEAQQTADTILYGKGFDSVEQEHDHLTTARAMLSILAYPEKTAKLKESLAKRLIEAGIPLDHLQ